MNSDTSSALPAASVSRSKMIPSTSKKKNFLLWTVTAVLLLLSVEGLSYLIYTLNPLSGLG